MCVCALVSTQASSAVVYREVFGNASGSDPLSYAGWVGQVWDEDSNFLYTTTEPFNTDTTSFPDNLTPISSSPAEPTELAKGGIENFFGGDFWSGDQLYFTEEFTLDASLNTLDEISYFANAQGGTSTRAAVRIGSDWYVQDADQTGFGIVTVTPSTTT